MLPLSPGPDSSLEISPNKKRSIPGNDLCPQVWDEPLMAVTGQGKKSIWEEFRKFCKDDDIPGETLSILTLFRVEEPFNDPVLPLVAETPDLISRCHPETPYDDDRPKADRRTDGDWVSEEVDERPNAVDNDLDVDKPKETLQNDERPSAVAIMQAPSFSRIGKKRLPANLTNKGLEPFKLQSEGVFPPKARLSLESQSFETITRLVIFVNENVENTVN